MPIGIYKHRSPWNKGLKGKQIAWNKGLKGLFAGIKHPMYGKHHTEKTREKMRMAKLGKLSPKKGIKTGKPAWNSGKKCPQLAGKNCHLWKGGIYEGNKKIRKSFEYRIWRTAVFTKDNYICVWCGQRGGRLEADHIKPFSLYPALRFAIDNGRTLCKDCHRKTDNFGGKSRKEVTEK